MVITSNNIVADLVMAMLAVNQWRLDQSAEIFDELKRGGLFSPQKISSMSHGELHTAIKAAKYSKADFVVDLICDRLFDMAEKLSADGEAELTSLCASGDKEAARRFAMKIKGVGPKVFENFWLLVNEYQPS